MRSVAGQVISDGNVRARAFRPTAIDPDRKGTVSRPRHRRPLCLLARFFMHVLCTALRPRRRRSVGRSLRALALLFQIIVDRALSLTSGAILRIKMDDDVNLDAAPSTSGAVYRAFGPNRVLDLRPSRDGY